MEAISVDFPQHIVSWMSRIGILHLTLRINHVGIVVGVRIDEMRFGYQNELLKLVNQLKDASKAVHIRLPITMIVETSESSYQEIFKLSNDLTFNDGSWGVYVLSPGEERGPLTEKILYCSKDEGPPQSKMQEITIKDFKCWRHFSSGKPRRLKIGTDIKIIVGNSGMGKTSLINAIKTVLFGGPLPPRSRNICPHE